MVSIEPSAELSAERQYTPFDILHFPFMGLNCLDLYLLSLSRQARVGSSLNHTTLCRILQSLLFWLDIRTFVTNNTHYHNFRNDNLMAFPSRKRVAS